MSCNVCLYAPDDLDSEFYSERTVKARTPHVCEECNEPIRPGMPYQRAVGKLEGSFFAFASCLLCAEIRRVFHCGGSFYLGTLWSDMKEDAFPELTTASECFRELSVAAKERVLERWHAWKGLTTPAAHQGGLMG